MRITLRVVRVLPWRAEVFGVPSVWQSTDKGPQRSCSSREPSARSRARIQTSKSSLRVRERELILLVLMTPTGFEPLKNNCSSRCHGHADLGVWITHWAQRLYGTCEDHTIQQWITHRAQRLYGTC